MNLIQPAEAGDAAGVLEELGALTPAQRAGHAKALAIRAQTMEADRGGYTDEQRTAQRVAELGCQVTPEAAADWLLRNQPRHPYFDQYPGHLSGDDWLVQVASLYPPGWRAELVARLAAPAAAPDLGNFWFPLAERIIADTGCPVPVTDVFVSAWLADRWRSQPAGRLAERLRNDDLSPVLLPLAVARPGVPLLTRNGWFAPYVQAFISLSAEGVVDRDTLIRRIFADLASAEPAKLRCAEAADVLTALTLTPRERAAVADDRVRLTGRFLQHAHKNFMGRYTSDVLRFLRALAPTAAENALFTSEHLALLETELYKPSAQAAIGYAQEALLGADEAGLLESGAFTGISARVRGDIGLTQFRVAGLVSRLSAGKAVDRGPLIERVFGCLTSGSALPPPDGAADVLRALALTPDEHAAVAGERARLVASLLASLLDEDGRKAIADSLEFLRALAPTTAENACFAREYIALLDRGSTVADRAQEALLGVDEAGLLEAETFTEVCQRTLLRPEKKLVRAQLAGIDRAARRDPARAARLVADAATAFQHQDPALQGRALDVIARHLRAAGDSALPGLRAAAEGLSPALAARAAELLGPQQEAPGPFTDVLPAVPVPRPVPVPAATAAEVAQEVAAVVAGDQDVAAFERALDGLVRHASSGRAALAEALKPVMRRKPAESPDCRPADLYDVARAVRGEEPREYAFHVHPHRPGDFSLAGAMLAARLSEAIAIIEAGTQPLLLAVPTLATGALDAGVLVERLAELEELGVTPAPVDLAQALLRVTPTDDTGTLRAASALHSEAGQRLARWLRAGGLPHQDSRPEGNQGGSLGPYGEPARSGVVLDPSFPLVATALIGPYRKRTRILADPPAPFWVAQLPHHRDETAARDVAQGGGQAAEVLSFLAEADGPAGYALHLALAHGLAATPHGNASSVDALLVLAARGQLDTALLGRLLGKLLRQGWEANRVAESLRAAAGTGAHGTVWAVLEAAIPGLLRDTPLKGAVAFLSLAAECASRCGAKGEIPEVSAVAQRGGSSQTVKNARLLRDALR